MQLLQLVAQNFHKIQFGILIVGFFIVVFYLRGRQGGSQFRQREADRPDLDRILKQGPSLTDAKLKRPTPPPPPLQLPGIRLQGAPHEILGVRENASELEINTAYKDAIKRFHPDTIQGVSKDQLRFYQEASARINEAKVAMIKKIRG